MELLHSGLSPFVRKVLVTAHEIGVAERIALLPVNARERPEEVRPLNPLGKIPALRTDAGDVLFDSAVICEYLDTEFGANRLLPARGAARWRVLTLQALADGMADAVVLIRNERARPAATASADWIAWQVAKVEAALDRLESLAPGLGAEPDLGTIATACALGYAELRYDDPAMLARRPALARVLAAAKERPSFRATAPRM